MADSSVAEALSETVRTCDGDAGSGVVVTNNPVAIASGTKLLTEVDFEVGEQNPIEVVRSYRSDNRRRGAFGQGWNVSFEFGLESIYESLACTSSLYRTPDCFPQGVEPIAMKLVRGSGGAVELLERDEGEWSDSNDEYLMQKIGDEWVVTSADGATETYNLAGQPKSVLDNRGNGWSYTYTSAGKLVAIAHSGGQSLAINWIDYASNDINGRIGSIVRSDGKTYTYTYTGNRNVAQVSYPSGLGSRTYHYENAALPWAVTGISLDSIRHTRYSYHADGRVASSGLETNVDRLSFAYGTNFVDVTNTTAQTKRYNIANLDGTNVVTGVERPESLACPSGITNTLFDGNGRVSVETDALGNKRRYSYSELGKITRIISGESPDSIVGRRITNYQWNGAQTRIDAVREFMDNDDQPGNLVLATHYSYYPDTDSAGRARLLSSVTQQDGTEFAESPRTVSYDYTMGANGQVKLMFIDGAMQGADDTMTMEYDLQGHLIGLVNEMGHSTTFGGHNVLGLPGTSTDPNGLVTNYIYDDKGRLTSKTVLAETGVRVTTFRYNAFDLIESATDASNRTVHFEYDSAGRLVRTYSDAVNPIGEMASDEIINEYGSGLEPSVVTLRQTYHVEMEVWGGPSTMFPVHLNYLKVVRSFDQGGLLSREFTGNFYANTKVSYSYDANQRLESITNGLNLTASTTRDAHGRISEENLPSGSAASYTYDVLGRVTSVIDLNGLETRYTRNGFGDVVERLSPDNGLSVYTHDANGRIATEQKADGTVTSFVRDALGRVTMQSATWAAATGYIGATEHHFVYDSCPMGVGRLCHINDRSGETSYSYNRTGEMLSQSSRMFAQTFQVNYTYDAFGRRILVEHGQGFAIRYGYTADHRVRSIEVSTGSGQWRSVIGDVVYMPFGGPVKGLTFGNGFTRTQSYNLDGQLVGISGSGALNPQNLAFGYDASGAVSSISNSKNPSANQQLGYNTVGQLVSVATASGGNQSWDYDFNGNRTSHTSNAGSQAYAYSYGTNRLEAISGSDSRALSYDANGNLSSESRGGVTVQRTYDGFDRLVKLYRPSAQVTMHSDGSTTTLPAGTWNYEYNGLGQRALRHRKSGKKTIQKSFLYDSEGMLLAESGEGDGGYLGTFYIWLGGVPVGVFRGGQLYFVHTDQVGRPEVVTTPEQEVAWRANNLPFDRKVSTDLMGGLALGFPGQIYDSEAGTWYNMFRDYDAGIGRYTTFDPIGQTGGMNPYSYVGGNPVSRFDPHGLIEWLDVLDFQGTTDFLTGWGDALTFQGTAWLREAWNIHGVDTCSSVYLAGQVGGTVQGAFVPVGRIAYMAKVGLIPRMGLSAPASVALRTELKAYFRGRPFSYWLRNWHSVTYEGRVLEGYSDAAIIAGAGRVNAGWSAGIIGAGTAGTVQRDNNLGDACECSE